MLPMPFAGVITLQLWLQHGPPMLLIHARPRMVRIVMFGNALRSHLRLQLEPPTPLSHRFVNLLGFRLHLALKCALVTFIIGHVRTLLLGCRGHDRGPACAKPDEVEAQVKVVVVEVRLSVVVAGAMIEDGLGNMHNKW